MTESSSAFIVPIDFSDEWRDITLVQKRTHTLVYTATRYGRRFLLKGLASDVSDLTDYRLQQEREFQLGIQLVHPNIAATYSLEDVRGAGRCIVQEWVDGVTLSEWLETSPSKMACERVFEQLLDALEYIHGLQLVHRDIKADNILITRNGANVKLIDFGLSAIDSTLTPNPNDARTDIMALGRILQTLLPQRRVLSRRCRNGNYSNIAALRKVINLRSHLFRLFPIFLSVTLLTIASVFFYLSLREHHTEKQRQDTMIAIVDSYLANEREQIIELINRPDSFDCKTASDANAYAAYLNEYTAIRKRQWIVRDSLADIYSENDILWDQVVTHWNHKEVEFDIELYPQLLGKRKP